MWDVVPGAWPTWQNHIVLPAYTMTLNSFVNQGNTESGQPVTKWQARNRTETNILFHLRTLHKLELTFVFFSLFSNSKVRSFIVRIELNIPWSSHLNIWPSVIAKIRGFFFFCSGHLIGRCLMPFSSSIKSGALRKRGWGSLLLKKKKKKVKDPRSVL